MNGSEVADRVRPLRRLLAPAAAMLAAGCKESRTAPAVHVAGSDAIRIGVVGCGSRGRGAAVQAVEAARGVRVTALADLFPDAIDFTLKHWADRPRDLFGVPRARCFVGFDAYREILSAGVDYVILTAPGGFRPAHLAAAIAAGKHVYAEKPIAVDPAGVRAVLAAGKLAAEKKLGVLSGAWRRHDPSYVETVKRLHGGAIGRIRTASLYCMNAGFAVTPRQPGWSDAEWQIRNFPYFTWLSGDFIVEHHMHQHDVARWVLGEAVPKYCVGMGGRQVRTGPEFGQIYDHFAVDYEFDDGPHAHSFCRQMERVPGKVAEIVHGDRGWADVSAGRITTTDGAGKGAWRYKSADAADPWRRMHADLFASIRAGTPVNEATESAHSHLMSIMGRMSAYTGQLVRWTDALNSPLDLMPKDLKLGPLPTPPVPMPGRPTAS